MKAISLAQPCRNFCILSKLLIDNDPKDGREKLAIVTYVANGTGRLFLIDTKTKESESYDLPNDEGAWALIWLKDRAELLIGTCSFYGSLHSFNLKTRSFAPPLRLESETYLWNFALGKDGCVYASTFPGCILVKYDPEKRELINAGKVGTNEKNQYSRHVYTNADGNILVSAGYAQNQAFYYDVISKKFTQLGADGDRVKCAGEDFICLENENTYQFLDAFTLEPIGKSVDINVPDTFKNCPRESVQRFLAELNSPPLPGLPKGVTSFQSKTGSQIGIQGQELYYYKNNKTEFMQIPCDAPATAIMTITADGNTIWGSCEFGQTIFSYDIETGTFKNTSQVTSAGGEVYGIVPLNGKIYLTSYVGGDHIVYDPLKNWEQRDNINPRNIGSVSPQMVRPHGKSVLGPDGNIWTGWYANYGVYGGGISRINVVDETVDSWFQLIENQAIEHIIAGKNSLFAVTSGEASGLPAREDGFYLLKLDTNCTITWKRQFPIGIHFSRIAIANGLLYVSTMDHNNNQSKLLVFDENTMEELTPVIIGDSSQLITDLLVNNYNNNLIVFTKGEILRLSLPSCKIIDRCLFDGTTQTTTIDNNGNIYFASQKTLYELEI